MALRRAWPCQAPGARLLLGCVALLCLAVAVPAVDELQSGIIVNQNCSTVDSAVTAALQGLTDEASVWHLGSGCSRLEENFVCSPINRSIAIEGAPDGCSVWDTEFDLYQFSAEPGASSGGPRGSGRDGYLTSGGGARGQWQHGAPCGGMATRPGARVWASARGDRVCVCV